MKAFHRGNGSGERRSGKRRRRSGYRKTGRPDSREPGLDLRYRVRILQKHKDSKRQDNQ